MFADFDFSRWMASEPLAPVLLAAAATILLFFVLLIWLVRRKAILADASARLSEEIARLRERTERLAEAEADRSVKAERLIALQAEFAAIRATLAERDAESRRLEEDLGSARAALTDLRSATDDDLATLRASESDLKSKLAAAATELRSRSGEIESLRNELAASRSNGDEFRRQLHATQVDFTELRSRADEERKAADDKLALLQNARVQLSDQFKALAADILEEKSKSFSDAGRASIGTLLEPLKAQLADFKGKVEEVYINEAKERSALGEQVRQLMGLNQRLSKEANNLTTALRGQAKAQGNWGELILERVLEAAGLRKGIHYAPQESHARDDGSRVQPDIVLNLPGDRFMVVDSKVSLIAYDDYANSEDDSVKASALRRHLDSLRGHIKDLSSKNYQEIHGLKSLDFVILFVPVEPAFLVAVDRDPELWQAAWEKNILLVSPSQLMFVVRTVAQLWQKEELTKNAQDIARRGAALYDKLCGFVDDLDRIGKSLRDAQTAYERAYGKFATGNGNVIRQAEMLRALGLKTRGRLANDLVENAMDAEDAAALPAPDETADN